MADINSISVETEGFQKAEEDEGKIVYYMDEYDDLIINFFKLPPDIIAKDSSEKSIQENYRNVAAEVGGAIIEVKKETLGKLEAIKTIFKFPMQPSGVAYLGSYTIPFADCSYVIKVQCPEVGTSGVRDTTIFEFMMRKGLIKLTDDGPEGWMKDPYDESIKLPLMMNLSESEEFDEAFPMHPLSRLRKHMKMIKDTFKYDEELEGRARFEYGNK